MTLTGEITRGYGPFVQYGYKMDPRSTNYIVLQVWAVILAVFLLAGCSSESDQSPTPEHISQARQTPPIILITVDALRADHLKCYGYSKNTSPNIDQFAQDSLLFENCFSHAPETRPSFASILSGFLPHETKINESVQLPPAVETLAETLQKQGYKTAAVISNYLLLKGEGFEQGFMIYDDTMDQRELIRNWPERIAQHTTDRAVELIEQFHKDRLFMWIHYQDPHGPYTPPQPFADQFQNPDQKPRNLEVNTSSKGSLLAFSGCGGIPSYQQLGDHRDFYYYLSQYDAEIRYQDEHFKRLIDALKQFGLYDSALIIFSADHGEGMGEHNYFFAHGEYLYRNQVHVPLIIKYGSELTGRRTDFVQHLDILPTILNVLGLKVDPRFRGRDLRRDTGTKREIFAEMKSPRIRDKILFPRFSIMLDGLKLIYTPLDKQFELFDITTDPDEIHNLLNDTKYRSQANDLRTRLIRIHNEDLLGLGSVAGPRGRTPEELEKLKSLGYTR